MPVAEQSFLETEVLAKIADATGWTVAELRCPRRTRDLAHARHVAMWIARGWGLSFPDTARLLHRTDHTTAIHAVRHIDDLLAKGDAATVALVARVRAVLDADHRTAVLN